MMLYCLSDVLISDQTGFEWNKGLTQKKAKEEAVIVNELRTAARMLRDAADRIDQLEQEQAECPKS